MTNSCIKISLRYMKKALHDKQIKLIEYLKGIEDLEGISYWQIARETGLGNAQTVKHHLNQLEKLGYLRRNLSNPSQFEVLKSPVEDISYISLYGFAQCGNDAEFFSEGNLDDKIAISTKLFGISDLANTFAVRAKGDSMSPDILDNDIVIFQKQNSVDTGTIALVLDDGECKIKQIIKKDSSGLILRSTNRSYTDKHVDGGEFHVLGLAKGIMHSL